MDSYHGQDHPGEARCVAGRGSPPGRGRGQRIAHVRPRRVVPGEVGPEAKRKKTPRTRGLFGGQVVVGYFLASPNLPRSVLTNRDSCRVTSNRPNLPLTCLSTASVRATFRNLLACPAGLDHPGACRRPFAPRAMAVDNSQGRLWRPAERLSAIRKPAQKQTGPCLFPMESRMSRFFPVAEAGES